MDDNEARRIYEALQAGSTIEQEAARACTTPSKLKTQLYMRGYMIRTRPPVLSDEQLLEAYQRVLKGAAYSELASEYYVSPDTLIAYLRDMCRRQGLQMPGRRRKLTPAQAEKIKNDYESRRKTVKQICEEYDIGPSTLLKYVRRQGGQIKPSGNPLQAPGIPEEQAAQYMDEYLHTDITLSGLVAKYGYTLHYMTKALRDREGYAEASEAKRVHGRSSGSRPSFTSAKIHWDNADERRRALMDMYREPGMSLDELSAQTGISSITIRNIIKDEPGYRAIAYARLRNKGRGEKERYDDV